MAPRGLEAVLAIEVSAGASGDLQKLIRRMANENSTWGEERIANELLLKLGIQVSPRTTLGQA